MIYSAQVDAQKPSFIVKLINGNTKTGMVKVTIEDQSKDPSRPDVIDTKTVNVNTDDLDILFNGQGSPDTQACAELLSSGKKICAAIPDPIIDLSN